MTNSHPSRFLNQAVNVYVSAVTLERELNELLFVARLHWLHIFRPELAAWVRHVAKAHGQKLS